MNKALKVPYVRSQRSEVSIKGIDFVRLCAWAHRIDGTHKSASRPNLKVDSRFSMNTGQLDSSVASIIRETQKAQFR